MAAVWKISMLKRSQRKCHKRAEAKLFAQTNNQNLP